MTPPPPLTPPPTVFQKGNKIPHTTHIKMRRSFTAVRQYCTSSSSSSPPPPTAPHSALSSPELGQEHPSVLPSSPSWNPVQRSGFKPMSKQKLEDMVKQLKKERHELGTRNDWTKADWEEAKAEGLDTGASYKKPKIFERDAVRDRDEVFKKEARRAEKARGHTDRSIVYDGRYGDEEDAKKKGKMDEMERQKHELIVYMARKIVWETEEQYRNRLGIDDASFISRLPEDLGRGMNIMADEDPRFLQARYVEFFGAELECWKHYHVDIIRETSDQFQKKHWRVRDIAFCDNTCFVFVDNRHRPHINLLYSENVGTPKGSLWGRAGQMITR